MAADLLFGAIVHDPAARNSSLSRFPPLICINPFNWRNGIHHPSLPRAKVASRQPVPQDREGTEHGPDLTKSIECICKGGGVRGRFP